MFILGIGSNLGDSLKNLRYAVHLIQRCGVIQVERVSALYVSDALLPEQVECDWNLPFLNLAVYCKTDLQPEAVLNQIKRIEIYMGRKQRQRWAPRIIDIDILAWANQVFDRPHLHIPHRQLHKRPFALWPLLDLMPDWQHPLLGSAQEIAQTWGSRHAGQAPQKTRQILQRVDTPELMGILNCTPDSFSDGGLYTTVDAALTQAIHLFNEGAHSIDVGAESTRPNAQSISPKQEWLRLEAILQSLMRHWKEKSFRPKISIDTRHAFVAKKALDLGVDWINDVSGLEDPAMRAIVRESGVRCVFMHHLGIPADPKRLITADKNVSDEVLCWIKQRLNELIRAGIRREQLILDPGIGFGKTAEQSFTLLNQIERFKQLNLPILIGHSRKSFLNKVTDGSVHDRDFETALISYHLACKEVDFLRVHNVALNARALHMRCALS